MTIRVLIVDDHELARRGIIAMISGAPGIEIVGEAGSGREATECARRLLPDVVLMDVRMPDMDGLEATRQIKSERPRTAVVILTVHDNADYRVEALKVGAAGYLLKDITRGQLIQAVRQVADGGPGVAEQVLRGALQTMRVESPLPHAARSLTKRERGILTYLAEGLTNREMAEKLYLSPETVKSHVAAILEKLDLSDRTQAAVFAVRNGLTGISGLS
ncbi:MAG: response regulator transcription factor [Chloroflexota bacterium]|nr:response regulator transcription factor [Chloroflexota bacterium]